MTGSDGIVRAAEIRTAGGRTNRPIARLIPLEVNHDVTQEEQDSTHTMSMGCRMCQNSTFLDLVFFMVIY